MKLPWVCMRFAIILEERYANIQDTTHQAGYFWNDDNQKSFYLGKSDLR